MSRNSPGLSPAVVKGVAPREGCVSRNSPGLSPAVVKGVAPREGCVSRNRRWDLDLAMVLALHPARGV